MVTPDFAANFRTAEPIGPNGVPTPTIVITEDETEQAYIFHLFENPRYTRQHEMTDKPVSGKNTTDIPRRMPNVMSFVIKASDDVVVPTTGGPSGIYQSERTQQEQVAIIDSLNGKLVTVDSKRAGSIRGILRVSTNIPDMEFDDVTHIEVEVRELIETSAGQGNLLVIPADSSDPGSSEPATLDDYNNLPPGLRWFADGRPGDLGLEAEMPNAPPGAGQKKVHRGLYSGVILTAADLAGKAWRSVFGKSSEEPSGTDNFTLVRGDDAYQLSLEGVPVYYFALLPTRKPIPQALLEEIASDPIQKKERRYAVLSNDLTTIHELRAGLNNVLV